MLMKKICFLVVFLFSIISLSPAFAIKAKKGTAQKAKVNVKLDKEENSSTTTQVVAGVAAQIDVVKKEKKEKKFTKIFLPGHDGKKTVCQGIAYIPGDDMKMSDGSPRYVLLSYYPNKDIKNATAPVQLVVIDREVGTKKKEAIRRFSLYKNTKAEIKKALEEGKLASDSVDLDDIYDEDDTDNSIAEDANDNEEDDENETSKTDVGIDAADDNPESDVLAASDKEEEAEADEKDDKDDKDEYAFRPYRGHAGGIAVAGKYLWVASGFTIRGYDLEDITDFIKDTDTKAVSEKGLPKSLKALPAKKLFLSASFKIDARASFLSFDGKTLWVGEYVRNTKDSNSKPVKHHALFKHIAWIAGYDVDENGCPTAKTKYTFTYRDKERKDILKPDKVIAIRQHAQGMVIADDMIAVSVSCGIKNSKLAFYLMRKPKTKKFKVGGQTYSVEAYNTDKDSNGIKTLNKELPAQIQDLEYDGKYIYATFSCNSGKYKAENKGKDVKITKNFFLINLDELKLKNSKKKVEEKLNKEDAKKEAKEKAIEEAREKAEDAAKKVEAAIEAELKIQIDEANALEAEAAALKNTYKVSDEKAKALEDKAIALKQQYKAVATEAKLDTSKKSQAAQLKKEADEAADEAAKARQTADKDKKEALKARKAADKAKEKVAELQKEIENAKTK